MFDQDDVAALEERLDEGIEAIIEDLQRLTQANMADQIERFVAALEADLILPEDFVAAPAPPRRRPRETLRRA